MIIITIKIYNKMPSQEYLQLPEEAVETDSHRKIVKSEVLYDGENNRHPEKKEKAVQNKQWLYLCKAAKGKLVNFCKGKMRASNLWKSLEQFDSKHYLSIFRSMLTFSLVDYFFKKKKTKNFIPNYQKIFHPSFFKKKTKQKKNTISKPATIFSFSYGHKSLQVCAFQAILKQLLSSIHILWNSFQALMENPCTLLNFTLSKNKSIGIMLHASIQSSETRDIKNF